jgi:Tol biopolymer transport system component
MSVRSQARVVVGLVGALGCFASAVPVAEASFPGGDGLIAFLREGPPFNKARNPVGAWTIWVANPSSGRTRQLTRVPRRCGQRGWTWNDSEPSYSASGRLITFLHEDSCDPRFADGIYIMRADGSGRRLIRRADEDLVELLEFPAFSPSGRQVAFNQFLGGSQIISVPRAGERPVGACDVDRRCTEVFFPRYSETLHPAWSSGGKLAFTLTGFGNEEETGHIGIATPGDVDRESVTRLATRSRRDAMPDWSPNEDRLVFHREKTTRRDLEGNVLTAFSRGKHRRPRRLTDTRDAFFPVWSPSGRKIAFARGEREEPNGTLWIMRAADGRRKRLLATDVYTSRISWQPRPRR